MKKSVLLFVSLSLTIALSAQFSDTTQLNTFIRDTIRDRRPDRVTAAQVQKGLMGVSSFLKPNAITKAGQGLSTVGDSIVLGGGFEGPLGLSGEGYSSFYINYTHPDLLNSGNFLLSNNQIKQYVFFDPSNVNEMYINPGETSFNIITERVENNVFINADSFYIGSNPSYGIGEYTKFRVSKDGYVRMPRYRNNATEDSVLITDTYGNVKQKKLPLPIGIPGMVQYKSRTGAFGGSPSFVWDEAGNTLNINGIEGGVILSPDGYISVSNSNPSATPNIALLNDQGESFQILLGGSEASNKTVLSSSLPTEIISPGFKLVSGKNFIGGEGTATARLHIAAGTTAANTAPLKLTIGPLMTSPESGAIEFDGIHFYGTIGSTRYQLDQQILKATLSYDFPDIISNSNISTTVNIPGAAVGDIVEIATKDVGGWLIGEIYTAWVSSTNTVTVRLNNLSVDAMDVPLRNFNITVRKY